MSRHGSARVQRRPRWSTLAAGACITVLAAAGVSVALLRPITTPAPAPLDVGYSRSVPSSTTATSAVTETPPAPSAASSSSTGGVGSRTTAPATAVTVPVLPPASASVAAPPPGRVVPAIAAGEPCRPVRLAMAELGVDASVVTLSLTPEGDLGTPSDQDKTSAGWFPSVLAGAARGTVLMDGHTYHDGSAIFRPTFKQQVRAGMVMRLSCSDGHAFSYRIAEVALDVSPDAFPSFVAKRALYASDGPPQLVMITCTDYNASRRVWDNRAILIATPIG